MIKQHAWFRWFGTLGIVCPTLFWIIIAGEVRGWNSPVKFTPIVWAFVWSLGLVGAVIAPLSSKRWLIASGYYSISLIVFILLLLIHY